METGKNYYIETYGCQMNVADTEVVDSLLLQEGYARVSQPEEANLILINTCSVREHAEQKIWSRLQHLKSFCKHNPKLMVGVIGCMVERVKERFFESSQVQILAGPDSYRLLPLLIERAKKEGKAADTSLSLEETYAEILPERNNSNGVSAVVSIMRGCDKFCRYCIVPYTRGRERSRAEGEVLKEIEDLAEKGYKEVTLLGQTVNSYRTATCSFPELLRQITENFPTMRIRYTSSYLNDMSEELLHVMASYSNICAHIHLPVQSGSSTVLQRMNRKYNREDFLEWVSTIRKYLPGCGLTTDLFCGFCGETEEEHQQTLSLMREVGFDSAFMFKYSERPHTYAARRMKDNVPEEVKSTRLKELIALQSGISVERNQQEIGKEFEVLVEGVSKKSDSDMMGRSLHNKVVIFPKQNHQRGDLVNIKVEWCTQTALIGNG